MYGHTYVQSRRGGEKVKEQLGKSVQTTGCPARMQ